MRALCAVGVLRPCRGFVRAESRVGVAAQRRAAVAAALGLPRSINGMGLGELRHTLKTGETAFDHLHGVDAWSHRQENQDSGRLFNDAMSAPRGSGECVLRAYDFSDSTALSM